MSRRDRLKLYIALHSYSQLWLIPWGYTKEHPADYNDLVRRPGSYPGLDLRLGWSSGLYPRVSSQLWLIPFR